MSEGNFIYQVSLKSPNGTLTNIRGADRNEFAAALAIHDEFAARFASAAPAPAPPAAMETVTISHVQAPSRSGRGPYRIETAQGVFCTFKDDVVAKVRDGATLTYKKSKFGSNDIVAVQG